MVEVARRGPAAMRAAARDAKAATVTALFNANGDDELVEIARTDAALSLKT